MKTNLTIRFAILIVLLLSLSVLASSSSAKHLAHTLAGTIERVSIASDGTQANNYSNQVSISADGRYVSFSSWASNLVEWDMNTYCYLGDLPTENCPDGFVHDRATGETTIVSVSSLGNQANSYSFGFVISANGRYVAFNSQASNLVGGDTNQNQDAFVHDQQTGETVRVSVASDGSQGGATNFPPSISAEGRYVAFESNATSLVDGDTNEAIDIFVHDQETGETTRVSISSEGTQANNHSFEPSISGEGRYVAFTSRADNLVNGDANGASDVFVHNRETGETTRISVASDGTQGDGDSWGVSISRDGRYVAFESRASNLVNGDTNNYCDTDYDGIYDDNCPDIFVHDRENGETMRVSVASNGTQGNGKSILPSISANGRYVAFESMASNLVDGDMNNSCFTGSASTYPYNCTDIFVYDRETGETQLISVADDGTQGNNNSYSVSISANGRFVAFISAASNLLDGDTNNYCDEFLYASTNCPDVFVYDRGMIFYQTYIPITVR